MSAQRIYTTAEIKLDYGKRRWDVLLDVVEGDGVEQSVIGRCSRPGNASLVAKLLNDHEAEVVRVGDEPPGPNGGLSKHYTVAELKPGIWDVLDVKRKAQVAVATTLHDGHRIARLLNESEGKRPHGPPAMTEGCLYPGCPHSRRTRGICHGHYQQWRSYVRRDAKDGTARCASEEELMERGLLLPKGTGGG